ncbi:molecular chaperone [Secundilactobacillus paracollinoides]|uniref:Molecular chaperone n=1 Tax=Secundilactobacillus paracollinoides TaxID=240427 RepID=A0A1B2IWD8_9LACO|nr:Hsp20/alpha crystallin family protein [Secundilactobacillus paracollinoides]ANZ60512.1 molecular chaperone [Secundilactobacillus paracollinoides]ANZ64823.1 molecular chaperone [Secundilactobacillus paracollinoides]ANZ66339.1 molecular chaperone [Secundilactobacillus paracollinoides]KRL79693.1 molecular chaperone (small heat shock protein) [Secundilactobacillus paracollinoides DSM 15502 = JCM 11969]
MARYLINRNNEFDPMNIFNDMGNFGRNFFNGNSTMKTDINETDKGYEVKAELPGFKKDGIHLDYRDDTLRINASHDVAKEDKDEDGRVLRQERSSSNITRSFYLPGVDQDNVKATYDGGILTLTLPKVAEDQKDSHHIEID